MFFLKTKKQNTLQTKKYCSGFDIKETSNKSLIQTNKSNTREGRFHFYIKFKLMIFCHCTGVQLDRDSIWWCVLNNRYNKRDTRNCEKINSNSIGCVGKIIIIKYSLLQGRGSCDLPAVSGLNSQYL